MGKKFVDKKRATTYNLVYRSQEDPLAFEEGGGQRVFVEAGGRAGRAAEGRPGHAAQTLQQSLRDLDLSGIGEGDAEEREVGAAAKYGVLLDDRNYDYTQHLRAVGGAGGVLLEAPAAREKRPAAVEIRDAELPAEALASQHRMDIKGAAYPLGPQPFMDPEVREVLEALNDDGSDASGDFDDDMMELLNADGPAEGGDSDSGDDGGFGSDGSDFDPDDVFAHVRRMKARQAARGNASTSSCCDESDAQSAGGSTGFSMSSSAMFRNEQLALLDEQYDRVEAMYESESEDDGRYDAEGRYIPEVDADGNAVPISSRPDFEQVLDEFLNEYELTGKKMQPVVEGGSGAGKLGTYRGALLAGDGDDDGKRQVVLAGARLEAEDRAKSAAMEEAELDALFERNTRARTAWDCESILSTYSTLENHPATIYEERAPRIRISRKTGLPLAEEHKSESESEEGEPEDGAPKTHAGSARPANETAEEKRARKKQAQEARRKRREQKKETRGAFAERHERRMQSRRDRQQIVVPL
ncbi:Protein ltv1 [Coemansia javaensis]|uniref:Protein ltv1 n=1 Tax=Coemansia javaensis TaxID=2761396 RepID=A0A9W8HFH2_9FUNG|nr:Protein ltv1 [Coemansia javaensis]